jgi:hypothetical protein
MTVTKPPERFKPSESCGFWQVVDTLTLTSVSRHPLTATEARELAVKLNAAKRGGGFH